MKISVFGLGYVGAVCCAQFAKYNHDVIGVDVNPAKVELINSGKSTIVEMGLEESIAEGIKNKRLRATTDHTDAILNSDISIICVGTPSQLSGQIDLTYVYKVVQQIAEILKNKNSFHTIVIRSTVSPGTNETCGQIVSDVSEKVVDKDFGIVSNPEFLREGTALNDFENPPYTIIGSTCQKSEEIIKELYKDVPAPVMTLQPKEAEMIKYANNNFHALKITFANEIGNICKEIGVDGNVVMDIVSQDTKLNLSPYYMKPGFAFGGSCLPKDVRALDFLGKSIGVKTPMISSLINSNEYQVKRGYEIITSLGKKNIGVLGLAFKAGTDDLRESPLVTLIEKLLGKDNNILVYDSSVHLSSLLGKNKDYITGHIPHIYKLLRPAIEEVVENSEVLVIGNKSPEFREVLENISDNKIIVDLVRMDRKLISNGNYVGICW